MNIYSPNKHINSSYEHKNSSNKPKVVQTCVLIRVRLSYEKEMESCHYIVLI